MVARVGHPAGAAAHPGRRHRPARRCRRRAGRHPRPRTPPPRAPARPNWPPPTERALADSGGDGVVGGAHLGGAVEHAQRRRAGRARVRRRGARGGFADRRRWAPASSRWPRRGPPRPAPTSNRCRRRRESAVAAGHALIVVHRLDNLRRSGRIGAAASWLGTALSLKPLLRIDDGQLVLAQRVRTASKAHRGDGRPGAATVVGEHGRSRRGAPRRQSRRRRRDGRRAGRAAAGLRPAIITDLGPVLALHVGCRRGGRRGAVGPDVGRSSARRERAR